MRDANLPPLAERCREEGGGTVFVNSNKTISKAGDMRAGGLPPPPTHPPLLSYPPWSCQRRALRELYCIDYCSTLQASKTVVAVPCRLNVHIRYKYQLCRMLHQTSRIPAFLSSEP